MSEPCERCDDDFVSRRPDISLSGKSSSTRVEKPSGPQCAVCGAAAKYYDPVKNAYFCELHKNNATILVSLY